MKNLLVFARRWHECSSAVRFFFVFYYYFTNYYWHYVWPQRRRRRGRRRVKMRLDNVIEPRRSPRQLGAATTPSLASNTSRRVFPPFPCPQDVSSHDEAYAMKGEKRETGMRVRGTTTKQGFVVCALWYVFFFFLFVFFKKKY